MWFLDFLYELFKNMVENPKQYTSTCCKNAYCTAFGNKHAFYIRVAARVAWLAAPSRQNFFNIVKNDIKDL